MIELISRDLNYSLKDREQFLNTIPNDLYQAVLLNTCNRVEVYQGNGQPEEKIAEHLFRVVSGLESALLGEVEIQRQVKEAYLQASQKTKLSKEMHKLFQQALRIGKKVRTETQLSKGAMSHSLAVLEILKQDHVALDKARVLIIGLSNINQAVLKYLKKHNCRMIFIANRTFQKAERAGMMYQAKALKFSELYATLKEVDIVISATSAPHVIIKKEHLISTQKMYMFDLAVPRDIDDEIKKMENVVLYNIEQIEARIKINQTLRREQISLAESIIQLEVRKYYAK